ncbi:MAG: WG repeat-containing protein [Prevotella sp.]|nr:WG repeat-containing protein [Prevotella sp.]
MRNIAITALILLATSLHAQVPRWSLHPKYASIEMLGNGNYIVSNNGKYGMMDAKENEVVPMQYDNLSPFRSNTSVLYNGGKFVGYMSDKGRVKEYPAGQYEVAEQPSFYDGYLLVSNINGYFYLRASDDEVIGPFTGGMPFSEGYAVVKVPKNPKKVLGGDYTINLLSAKTGKLERMNLGEYDTDDIDFMSSVSNGKSIIVLKKRFHEYDFNKGTLTPIHSDGNTANKKSRVVANERPVNVMSDDNGFLVQFKMGQMTFDPLLRLNSITYAGQAKKDVAVPEEIKEEKQSPLQSKAFPGTDLLGLNYNGQEILSAQFDKVSMLWGNEALVMTGGKYGVITVDPNKQCRFVLNDNMAIGFEHKTANTNIKAVCPPYMKPALMTLSSEDENCHINIDTRKENTNVETSVLTYQCALNILPEEIGLEKSSRNTKFALNYDGLKLTSKIIPFDAWYVNNYTVQIPKHNIEGSAVIAEILVNNTAQGGKNFFRDVTVEAEDSVVCNMTKITEEMYQARFYGWKDGSTLRFSVDITEDGCPTLSYDRSIAINTGKKASQSADEAPVVATQAKIKRKATKKPAPKKEEKKIITHF